VAGVVHEFVHVRAAEDRRRTLLGAYEVEQHKRDRRDENRPGGEIA
jgi:hypothetical protein